MMLNGVNNIYKRIWDLMQARGLTTPAFVSEVGISNGSFSDWRHGKSSPSVEKLVRIADYFGVTTDYLLGRDDRYPAPSEDACELVRIYGTLDREGKTLVLSTAYTEKRRLISDAGTEISGDSSVQ